MESSPVIVTRRPPIGIIAINRPEVRNALNLETWRRLGQAAQTLAGDDAIRTIILRGSDPQAFISGADISEFESVRADAAQARAYREVTRQALNALTDVPKPTIAMIAGICMGGGVQVALACDLRFAAAGTRFGISAVRLGLAYPLEGVAKLAAVTGPANASDILLSGRHFEADEALAMGLINRIVALDELETQTLGYAERLTANAPLSMAAAKFAIAQMLKGPEDRDSARGEEMIAACFSSADYREGVRAFMEKRRPRFKGH